MRKFLVLPMVGMLTLGVVGPATAAANVSNTSGSGVAISGEWSSENGYGYVSVSEDSEYGGYGEVYLEHGAWVECPDGGGVPGKDGVVPQDTTPGDGSYGFVGTRTSGYVDNVRIEVSKRLETGRATGTVELFTETVDECNGVYGGDAIEETGQLDVSVTGVGPLATLKGSGSYKVPSQYNEHQSYRARERQATGSVVAGATIDATFDGAAMTQVTWSDHANH